MSASKRDRSTDRNRVPDGGQMLLLAGFLLAGAAIMAIGAMTMVQRSETQLSAQEHQSMFNLFTNTRDRAITYFEIVDVRDTSASVDEHLDGYLQSQFQTARALSMDLNATLAGPDTRASMDETDFTTNPSSPSGENYADPDGGALWDTKGRDCYSSVSYDGKNDGLITDSNGKVLGAIFWLKLEASGATLEEFVVIDVPATEVQTACSLSTWEGTWGESSLSGYDDTLRDVDNTTAVPFAVGDDGAVLKRSDGGSWTKLDTEGPSGDGNDLHASDPTDDGKHLWVVGGSGEVGEYDAETNSVIADHSKPDGLENQFNDVAVTGNAGSATVFIVDASGNILRSTDDGSSWDTTTPIGNEIHAIDFYTPTDGIAVDDSGHVFETSDGGDSWTDTNVASRDLFGVDGVATDDLWVAAAGGDILHWDGSSWSQTSVDANGDDLRAIEMDQGEGYVVGQSGKIYHWDGAEWIQKNSQTSSDLKGISIDDRAIAVGAGGTIMET